MRSMLVIVLAFALTACTLDLTVDKRVWITNHIDTTNDVRTSMGSPSVPTTVSAPSTTTNTSDTKTDAQQAIEGALTIPMIP